MSVPNQKTIKVNKEICDKQHLYAAINLEAMSKAMNDLSGEEFKVWCYFAKNQNGYQFELSAKAVKEFAGTSEKTYQRSIQRMKDKGYLVQISGNVYQFNEVPCSQNGRDKTAQNNQAKMAEISKPKWPGYLSQNDQRNITQNTTYNTTGELDEKSPAFRQWLLSSSSTGFKF